MAKKKNWTGERLETAIFNETTIEHLHRYAVAADFVKDMKVLDIACGEGYGSNLLAVHAAAVTGIDADKNCIETARNTYQKSNLHFLEGRVQNIPAENNSFDTVVSFETLEHVDEQNKMLEECKRVLKENGLLIISTPNKEIYSDRRGYKNPFHRKELYETEFTGLLQKYFKNIQLLRQEIALSSLISSGSNAVFQQYAGDYQKISRQNHPEALYFIAFASDKELPPVPASIFNGQSIFEKALQDREKMVTQTLTYKTGHILLYPFKCLKRLFRK